MLEALKDEEPLVSVSNNFKFRYLLCFGDVF